jgi:hypothetical protein
MQARPRAWCVAMLAAGVLALAGVGATGTTTARAAEALTVVCPDVASRVTDVPTAAEAEVDRELANLEQQIAEVEARLGREPDQADSQRGVLRERRVSTIDRIVIAITRAGGDEPGGIRDLAPCSLRKGRGGGNGGWLPEPPPTGGATARPTPAPEERPTPSSSPTRRPVACPDLARRMAGTEDDAQAGLILRLAGLDSLAECVDPRAGVGAPPGRGERADDQSGVGGGAGLPSTAPPSWSRNIVTTSGEGLGLDPVIGTSILLLLLAGLTFLLIRADVVRLSRGWGATGEAPDGSDLT